MQMSERTRAAQESVINLILRKVDIKKINKEFLHIVTPWALLLICFVAGRNLCLDTWNLYVAQISGAVASMSFGVVVSTLYLAFLAE